MIVDDTDRHIATCNDGESGFVRFLAPHRRHDMHGMPFVVRFDLTGVESNAHKCVHLFLSFPCKAPYPRPRVGHGATSSAGSPSSDPHSPIVPVSPPTAEHVWWPDGHREWRAKCTPTEGGRGKPPRVVTSP